jgi:hypothetical protein
MSYGQLAILDIGAKKLRHNLGSSIRKLRFDRNSFERNILPAICLESIYFAGGVIFKPLKINNLQIDMGRGVHPMLQRHPDNYGVGLAGVSRSVPSSQRKGFCIARSSERAARTAAARQMSAMEAAITGW